MENPNSVRISQKFDIYTLTVIIEVVTHALTVIIEKRKDSFYNAVVSKPQNLMLVNAILPCMKCLLIQAEERVLI